MTLICIINQLKTPMDFNCLQLKYEVKVGIWLSDPYLYYNSIKDTPVCGHLKSIMHPIVHPCPWLYSNHLNKVCLRCVVLTIYDRHRCQIIARYTGKLKVKF